MEIKELIARLNFLYHKRQREGLTEAEQIEQSELRRQYIGVITGNVKMQLNRVQFMDPPEHDCDHHGNHVCEMDCGVKKH